MEKNVASLTWGDIYIAIKEQVYVELYAVGELMKECDKKTWANIIRSRINQVYARPGIFLCTEFIRLILKQSDLEKRWIIYHKG